MQITEWKDCEGRTTRARSRGRSTVSGLFETAESKFDQYASKPTSPMFTVDQFEKMQGKEKFSDC